jgi:hypothetical protein
VRPFTRAARTRHPARAIAAGALRARDPRDHGRRAAHPRQDRRRTGRRVPQAPRPHEARLVKNRRRNGVRHQRQKGA